MPDPHCGAAGGSSRQGGTARRRTHAGSARAPAGILPPGNLLCEPRDPHEIRISVAIDVDRQVAEVVVVVVGEVQFAEPVSGPRWCLIPVLARDDVEPSVLVDVGDCGGLARAVIDHERTELDVGGAGRRGSDKYADNSDGHRAHMSWAPANTR